MAIEPGAESAYLTVLSDLRRQKEEIESAMRLVERLMGVSAGTHVTASSSEAREVDGDGPGMFLSMSIPEATRKLLAMRRRAMSNAEIATELKAGGLAMNSADPLNTIGSVLTRRFHQVGDIVRVDRGKWGLQEWHPHTSFKRKPSDKTSVAAPATADPNSDPIDDPAAGL